MQKRTIAILGLFFFVGAGTVYAALVGSTSFETITITPSTGTVVDGTGDGNGWSGPWSPIQFPGMTVYDDSQVTDGAWSLLQDTTDTNNEPFIERVFESPIVKGRVTFDIRKNKTDRNNTGIMLSSGSVFNSANRATWFQFSPNDFFTPTIGNGDVVVYDGPTESVLVYNFQEADVWYSVEIRFNAENDKYNVFINGVKQNNTALDFFAPQTAIDRITIVTGATQSSGESDTPGSKLWIDNVRVHD